MIKKIVTLGLVMASVAYSWAAEPTGKVYSDKDLKNYTSESDERARAYDYSIIQIERARRRPAEEAKAEKEFREQVRRNVEKAKADLAEKMAEAEAANRKKEKEREARRNDPIPVTIIDATTGRVSPGVAFPVK